MATFSATAAEQESSLRPGAYPGSNGRKIAYVRNDAPLNEFGSKPCLGRDVWIMNEDGTRQTNITGHLTRGEYSMGGPTWSPDGKTLAFAYVRKGDVEDDGNEDVVYIGYYDRINERIDDAATVALLLPSVDQHNAEYFCKEPYGPTWSPDGKRLAMQNYYGTAVINVATREVTRLDPTQTPYTRDAAWSPAINTLAFEGFRTGGGRVINTMNVSGGDLRTLEWSEGPSTDDPCGGGFPWGCDLMHITRPDWSPDGKSIVASTGASGFSDGGRIAILDACSKTPKPLRVLDPAPRFLDNPFYRPAWSPDGTKIVFSDDGFEQDVSEPGGGHFEQDIFVMNADGTGVEPLTDTPGDIWESDPDWQPTRPPDEPPEGCKEDKLPIVFVPGFLGSNIICDVGSAAPKPLWPAIPNPDFLEMSLDSNGTANGNRNRCNRSARPSGQIADIAEGYKNLVNYLDGLPRQVGYYAYDWRKSPLLAVDGLDEKVDKILKKVKTEKVVLMAHSMGGLVVRGYVEAHPSKVDRVVTVGTPFLGAPKPWLALSHGWTTPEPNNLDRIIPNGDLKEFARNATGAYFLYPSEGFVEKIGRWLSVPSVDTLLPADAVPDAVNAYNGNGALLQQAYDSHSSLLEIIPTNGVEWQMVVGTGVQTLMVINENEGSEDPDYVFGNGDGTVPMVSAAMGNINPSAVHYACGVAHGTMSGTREVTKRINGYLMRGDPIKGAPAPCEVP